MGRGRPHSPKKEGRMQWVFLGGRETRLVKPDRAFLPPMYDRLPFLWNVHCIQAAHNGGQVVLAAHHTSTVLLQCCEPVGGD